MNHKSDQTVYPPFKEKNYFFIFGVLFIYSGMLFTGILAHPMWRDEFHPWLMSKASASLLDLFRIKASEGHPDLWYLMVYAIQQMSAIPLVMQLMHGAIASTTAFLILKYAPFSRLEKSLLIFGYFYFFEYAIISRNYAIGILLVTLLLARHPYRPRFNLVNGLILALLAQTNLYGIIFSVAFLLTWIYGEFEACRSNRHFKTLKTNVILSLLVILAGIGYAVYSVIPPPSGYFSGASHFSFSQLTLKEFIHSMTTPWKAWVPVPELIQQFWDTNILQGDLIQAILSLFMLVFGGILFSKRPTVLFLFIIGSTGIIAFILMYYFGYIRHHGHLYILLVVCLWLRNYYPEVPGSSRFTVITTIRQWLNRKFNALFMVLLLIQFFVGMGAYLVHFTIPFSASKVTADYIKTRGYDRFMLAGDQDVCMESLMGYLDKQAFLFSRNSFSNYLIYDTLRKIPEKSAVLKMADSLQKNHGDTVLLIMNYPLTPSDSLNLVAENSFTRSIRCDEIYYLYLLCPEKPTHSAVPAANL